MRYGVMAHRPVTAPLRYALWRYGAKIFRGARYRARLHSQFGRSVCAALRLASSVILEHGEGAEGRESDGQKLL